MTNVFDSIVLTPHNGFPKREDHVLGAEGAAYKARHRPGAVTIHNGEVFGKYMTTIWSVVFMCLTLR
jgi:hypothetical protein